MLSSPLLFYLLRRLSQTAKLQCYVQCQLPQSRNGSKHEPHGSREPDAWADWCATIQWASSREDEPCDHGEQTLWTQHGQYATSGGDRDVPPTRRHESQSTRSGCCRHARCCQLHPEQVGNDIPPVAVKSPFPYSRAWCQSCRWNNPSLG